MYDILYLIYRWLNPVIDVRKVWRAVPGYLGYCRDWIRYGKISGAERRALLDTAPYLAEKTPSTPFDRHYFYQDIWAFRKIKESRAAHHIDVGSQIDFVGFLTIICKVTFIDIRPLQADLPNFVSVSASILGLPFGDETVKSLSCLHVAEHIGLGRYGDSLDPQGSKKACRELARVLARGGNLYFSVPIGKPRLCFNAHRIHSINQILEYFSGLQLLELSGIDDDRQFKRNIDRQSLEDADYACGLFHFTKA